jgi:hypothetical protein
MEILFGDKKDLDIVGLGKLFANRCAYPVGDSYSERLKILI